MEQKTLSNFEIATDAVNALVLRKRFACGARSVAVVDRRMDLDKGVLRVSLEDGRVVQYTVTITGKARKV